MGVEQWNRPSCIYGLQSSQEGKDRSDMERPGRHVHPGLDEMLAQRIDMNRHTIRRNRAHSLDISL
jgi:hypothetical protein